MADEYLHIKPLQEGECEVHDWPTEGLPRRLVAAMRERHALEHDDRVAALVHVADEAHGAKILDPDRIPAAQNEALRVRATAESPVTRCRLESGDVTMLAGPARRYLHTVERIIPAPLLSPLQKPGRISITLRVAG